LKITFPHYGNSYLAAKILFDGLGIDYIIPPMSNKKAVEKGALYSPEEICLPFKIMIGNLLESLEQGADTVVIIGSSGPCRFGEYGVLQKRILKKAGYNPEIIVLGSLKSKKDILESIKKISKASNKSIFKQIMALYWAVKGICLIDDIEKELRYIAPYEINKGDCKRMLYKMKRILKTINERKKAIRYLKYCKEKITKIPIDINKKPLKIALVGEIYTLGEPFANLYIEDKLMDYGVSSVKLLKPSWWVKDIVLRNLKLNSIRLKKKAKPYLDISIGGYGRETVGETIVAYEEEFDGAIQIFPLGCMPEIVTKPILEKISKDKDFPVITLIVDEMTGEAGYITRIEAFLDLLERRKEKCII